MAQRYLKFLLIKQHEVPFINTNEATKRLRDQTENTKCTNNHRSRIGLSTTFCTSHDPPDVIGLDKNTMMPLANSKTITDDVTRTLP